jgi:hypothetical protein
VNVALAKWRFGECLFAVELHRLRDDHVAELGLGADPTGRASRDHELWLRLFDDLFPQQAHRQLRSILA